MKITSRIRTGWPTTVLPYLSRSISQSLRTSSTLKIGITSQYEHRAAAYGRQYSEMILLYRTTSEAHVRGIEEYLIDRYWAYCDNLRGGGGGPLGKPPYYVYIVR